VKPRPLLEGAGLAALYIAPFASNFLTPSLGDAYHRVHPLTSIYRAILILVILVWAMAALGFFVLERLPVRWKCAGWLVPITLLPWLFFRSLTAAFADSPEIAFRAFRTGHYVAPATAVLALLLLLLRPLVFDRCVRGVKTSYAIAGFGLLVIAPQIGYQALRFEPRERLSFVRADLPPVAPSAPRIVWILMDELSYDQAFPSRQSDVVLPNFDSLAKSSIVFSAIRPVGTTTESVLPALLLGRPVVALRKPYADPPWYRTSPNGPWQRFAQNETIFAEARSYGWTTGVAGWYIPYCRLLPDVLDRCSWQYSEPGRHDLTEGLASTNSVSENMLVMVPFWGRIDALLHLPVHSSTDLHRSDYTAVMSQAKDVLNDSRIRFVFVHLPVPHPPGVFNRRLHTLSDQGTYLDNLVLADQSLGELRSILQSTPAANNTTLIVSSDHSWRTLMWRPTEDWSLEELRASRGSYDPRPVLMVQFPGSVAGQVVAKPVDALVLHRILEDLLRGHMHSPTDLNDLIDQEPKEIPHGAQAGN
jgi:Sulfatase